MYISVTRAKYIKEVHATVIAFTGKKIRPVANEGDEHPCSKVPREQKHADVVGEHHCDELNEAWCRGACKTLLNGISDATSDPDKSVCFYVQEGHVAHTMRQVHGEIHDKETHAAGNDQSRQDVGDRGERQQDNDTRPNHMECLANWIPVKRNHMSSITLRERSQ